MQTKLLKELESVLKEFPEYWQEEVLQRFDVVQDIESKNPSLISALLGNKTIREQYSTQVNDVTLFDFQKLIALISYKEYWKDSYTKFKNKIGLTADNQYLNYNTDVVISFPFKDCVLEGGMTKADAAKEEVYYNEIIAADEIDRLLSPKAFANAKRITKDSEEEVVDIEQSDNLLIKGNNIIALHSLKARYANKIKLIYIDPPYNTENDEFKYNDKFRRSTWLTFIKNRLEVAKDLLTDDGMVFVQCDDNEQAYLKVLMDEIFGEENFKECIVVKSSTPSGVNAVNVKRGERLFKLKEYILFYTKKPSSRFNSLLIKSDFNLNYRYEVLSTPSGYQVEDLHKKFEDEEKLIAYCLANHSNIYSLEKNNNKAGAEIKKVIEQSRYETEVLEHLNSKGETKLVYDGGVFVPLSERIYQEQGENKFGVLISDLWDDQVFQTNAKEGGVSFKSAKKPEKLLERIIKLSTKPNDIVLDFFAGSGTTCAVAHKMGRQWIAIEQMNYIEEITKTRLTSVIQGEQSGISSSAKWPNTGGGSFVYCELAKLNQNYIDLIINAKSYGDLLTAINLIKSEAYINYQVDVDIIMNTEYLSEDSTDFICFEALSLARQKTLLIEILDKNQLYVNLSEIDDADMPLTEMDKQFTNNFYTGRGE